jgi:hypothetical protein
MLPIPEMLYMVHSLRTQNHTDGIPKEVPLHLNWTYLIDLARWHGIFPLLAGRMLSVFSPENSSASSRTFATLIKKRQMHSLRQNLGLTAALMELERAFDEAGIRVLPWKGPAVGLHLYGSTCLRESGDLDFFFQEKNLGEILEITRRLGYRLSGGDESDDKYLYMLARGGEFTFSRERDQVIVEFHLRVLPRRFRRWQDARADLERASTVCRLAGHDFFMQAPEDMLVSLCVHATKHNWERLKWSCDIAQFLKIYGDKLDWKSFLIRLRTERKHSVVLLGLALAANLFDLTLPSAVQEALRQSPDVAPLAEAAAAHIMSGATGTIEVRYERKMIAFLCPSLWACIVYNVQPVVALNSDDLYIPVHNRILFFMNYFFRVMRLVRKYGPMQLATKTAAVVRSAR